MKTVSIIIPVYNVAAYLPQCLESVLSQTYPALEVILVDDGSKDDSGSICDRCAQQDARVTVIHQTNAGAANAKNAGLDRATGDFITFIDSDDYVERNWIENLMKAADQYGADVVEYDFDRVYPNRSEVVNGYRESSVYTAEEYLRQYLDHWTCSLFWNKLFRSSLVAQVRFRKERRCIDDEFFTYKVVSGAQKVVRIPEVLYHYRQRASSAVSSEKNSLQITDDALEILIERYQWIRNRFPALCKIYLKHDVEILFYFAADLLFQRETMKKFRKIARFYFKEAILRRGGKTLLLYVLRLQTVKLCQDAAHVAQVQFRTEEEYFA